jgi:hypothetical protein
MEHSNCIWHPSARCVCCSFRKTVGYWESDSCEHHICFLLLYLSWLPEASHLQALDGRMKDLQGCMASIRDAWTGLTSSGNMFRLQRTVCERGSCAREVKLQDNNSKLSLMLSLVLIVTITTAASKMEGEDL